MKHRYYLSSPGILNALGSGVREVSQRLMAGDASGMVIEAGLLGNDSSGKPLPAKLGRVSAALPLISDAFSSFDCRSNQMLLAVLTQIEETVQSVIQTYGSQRIGVVLGGSTSGIAEGVAAVTTWHSTGALPASYRYSQQQLGGSATFLTQYLGLGGPAYVISTACTSSAKAMASARNLLKCGVCDAVIVGGVDSLSALTVQGFAALDSLSPLLCNPMSAHRSGINIGEGAVLFVMTKDRPLADTRAGTLPSIELLGIGETSDAHHMSAPQPEGRGAEAAMREALLDAGLQSCDVDYLNLHATATPLNDAMESLAVARLFPPTAKHPRGVPYSGTKPLTGHLLGTAGATEIVFCQIALATQQLPPHVWDGTRDAALPELNLARPSAQKWISICMSNSFAFGGNNASVIVGLPLEHG